MPFEIHRNKQHKSLLRSLFIETLVQLITFAISNSLSHDHEGIEGLFRCRLDLTETKRQVFKVFWEGNSENV